MISTFTLLLLLGAWEISSRYEVINSKLIPAPTLVIDTAIQMIQSGELLTDISASLERWVVGFGYALVFGISIGLATGRSPLLRAMLEPIVQLLRPIPAIAFVPIAIIWFGVGEQSKHFLVAWGAFFPIWVNAHIGTARVEMDYFWAAKSLGANQFQTLYSVVLPAAIPFVLAGIRVGIAVGFICLVAAEMAGSFHGLGYRITASHMVFRLDKMFVALILLGGIGTLTDRLFHYISLKLLPWIATEPDGGRN